MKKADNFDASKWLVENKITFQSRLNENKTLGPYDFDIFKWKNQPSNPNAKLEDLENEDTVSKGDFWKSDIIGNDSSTPTYGSENNGVWTFAWESGEISGFIEGEDFTLSNLNENELNPITKKKFDNLIAMVEKAIANKDQETLYKIYNKGLNTGSKGWGYFIDSLVDKGLARVDDRRMLKFNLNESKLTEEQYSSERVNPRDQEVQPGVVNHNFDTIDIIDLDNGYKVKIISTYYFRDPGVKGYSDTNSEENPMISGVKTTLIDPSGKPIKNHNFTGSGQWWMLTSGKKYFMPQIKAWWEDKIGRLGLSESKLNEDLAAKIAALPDFNSAMDSEKSELIVGKYVVVRYDDSEYETGQDMYVVWDNTVNQDEIGSYDDVPEFESEDPAEVANWLKQNA